MELWFGSSSYAPFDNTDIADTIDQLSMNSGPGPNGVPSMLMKRARTTVSLMLYNIIHDKGERPDILKLGFICPILKPGARREKNSVVAASEPEKSIIKKLKRDLRRRIVGH